MALFRGLNEFLCVEFVSLLNLIAIKVRKHKINFAND